MARRPSSVRKLCANRFFSQTNGRVATKLAHDGLQVSVHPECVQGQCQGQRSRDTRTFGFLLWATPSLTVRGLFYPRANCVNRCNKRFPRCCNVLGSLAYYATHFEILVSSQVVWMAAIKQNSPVYIDGDLSGFFVCLTVSQCGQLKSFGNMTGSKTNNIWNYD